MGDGALELARVIGPVQRRLPLLRATRQISSFAILLNRRNVPADRPPPSDLPRVVGRPAAHVIPAVPLEPSARILRTDPAVAAPYGQRLRGVHAEAVEACIASLRRQLRVREPARGKLGTAVRHILP